MAHEISEASVSGKAEAFYAVDPAWHGLGTVLDNAPDSASAIDAAGLGWRVESVPMIARRTLQTPEGDIVTERDVPEHVANIRTDTGAVLGVVGSTYEIVQNRDAFAFLDGLAQDSVIRYESAGALKSGKLVWLLARMPSVDYANARDASRRYVLFTNSHDGSGAVRVLPTSVRVVCWNTLSIALAGGTRAGISIRHSGDIDAKLRAGRVAIARCDAAFTGHADACRLLAGKQFTPAQLARFLDTVLPPIDAPGRAKTNRDADRATVLANLESDRQKVAGLGTFWAAFNAFSELIDHGSTTRGADANARRENRFQANLGLHGRASDEKRDAFALALSMAS